MTEYSDDMARAGAQNIQDDLGVLLRRMPPAVALKDTASPSVIWLRLRNLCSGTESPKASHEIDFNFQPQTEFGSRVLYVIRTTAGLTDVAYGEGEDAGLCPMTEPRFFQNTSPNRLVGDTGGTQDVRPIVVSDGPDVVGLYKFRRPGILGLADRPDYGIFDGMVSLPSDTGINTKIAQLSGQTEQGEVSAVDIGDLFVASAGMRVVRATTFMIDSQIRESTFFHGIPGRQGTNDVLQRVTTGVAGKAMRRLTLE